MSATDPRLDEIQARLDAATPGPWAWSPEESVWGDCGPNLETVERGPIYSDGSQGAATCVIGSWGHDANGIFVEDADAEFIAAAPGDVRYLLAELRKAHESLAEAWEQGRDAEFQRSVMKRQADPNPYRAAVAAAKGNGE